MNEIHLICRYLYFHGITDLFLILGGFLMSVLCLKCLPRASLVCPHGNPLLHSVAAHSVFSSERRGLCYPGPKMTDTVALESLRNTEGDFLPNLRSRSLSDHLRPDSCLSWSGSFKKIDGSSLVLTVPERDSEISWSAHSWAVHARKKDKEKV